MDWKEKRARMTKLLGLETPPVAVSFSEQIPEGVPKVSATAPAGCGYWKSAAEGGVFYTEASDHYACPIGAWTHRVDLPPGRSQELEGMMDTMVSLGYITREEISEIPRMAKPFRYATYAPLGEPPGQPDIALIRGNARQLMLLVEAARVSGALGNTAPSGKPTCAVIPLAIESRKVAVSFACVGNRIYTGATDGEAYCAIPADCVDGLLEKLEIVTKANSELAKFHRARLAEVA